MTEIQDYLGFGIEAGTTKKGFHTSAFAHVDSPDGSTVTFTEWADPAYRSLAGVPSTRVEFPPWLLSRAIARARAAIALDELQNVDKQRFDYHPEQPSSKADDEIQMTILTALRRIKRLDPQHFGHVPLDAAGICLLREIRKDEFDYNLRRLQDRGWVEPWGMGWDDNNNNVRFTELGLQSLDQLERTQDATGAAQSDAEPAVNSSAEYFVAHEFSAEQIDDLRAAIDSALSGSGLTSYYADTELRQGHIFKDKILHKIRVSRFGIYEISNPSKPNVFLELGAGLALGKPCIIICRKGTQVPADLQGLDRVEYQSYRDLTGQLAEKLQPYLQ